MATDNRYELFIDTINGVLDDDTALDVVRVHTKETKGQLPSGKVATVYTNVISDSLRADLFESGTYDPSEMRTARLGIYARWHNADGVATGSGLTTYGNVVEKIEYRLQGLTVPVTDASSLYSTTITAVEPVGVTGYVDENQVNAALLFEVNVHYVTRRL